MIIVSDYQHTLLVVTCLTKNCHTDNILIY